MSNGINYAKVYGIESVAGAVIFAILYVPFFVWFVRKSIGRPTYVFIILALFCAIRIAAFTIRAILAGLDSAGENLSLLIADQVLTSVGFFGLLFSAYTLVLDRELLTGVQPPRNGPIAILTHITGNRWLFKSALTAAVALGIVGATQASSSNPLNGSTLRKVSTIIFLVLTVLLGLRTLYLARIESTLSDETSWGGRTKHASLVLCVIALLLLVREIFATATMSNPRKQTNEHLWYPLYSLPEILAVAMYSIPNLMPPRSELPK